MLPPVSTGGVNSGWGLPVSVRRRAGKDDVGEMPRASGNGRSGRPVCRSRFCPFGRADGVCGRQACRDVCLTGERSPVSSVNALPFAGLPGSGLSGPVPCRASCRIVAVRLEPLKERGSPASPAWRGVSAATEERAGRGRKKDRKARKRSETERKRETGRKGGIKTEKTAFIPAGLVFSRRRFQRQRT